MTAVALSRMHFPVTTLGPGRRLGIWFQGCSIRCRGCVSMDTWAPGSTRSSVERIIEAAAPALLEADGVTVSGGEPFDQPEALHELLGRVRDRFAGDILVYSGHPLELLAERLPAFEGLIDCLVADPFDASAPQRLALRGGDNQRMVCLTELGRERFRSGDRIAENGPRSLDIMFDDDTGEVFLAGIPRPGDMRRLAALLALQGHVAVVTEDGRPAS